MGKMKETDFTADMKSKQEAALKFLNLKISKKPNYPSICPTTHKPKQTVETTMKSPEKKPPIQTYVRPALNENPATSVVVGRVELGPPLDYVSDKEIEEVMLFQPDSDKDTEAKYGRHVENVFFDFMDQERHHPTRTTSNKKAKTSGVRVRIPAKKPEVQSGSSEESVDWQRVQFPDNAFTETFVSTSMKPVLSTVTEVSEDDDWIYNNMPREKSPRKAVSYTITDQRKAFSQRLDMDVVEGKKRILPQENKSTVNRRTGASTLETTAKAVLPKNLILQQDSTQKNMFYQNVLIKNPTSTMYAFKVGFGQLPSTHFTASPDIGLLKPKQNVFVEIKAIHNRKESEVLPNGKIEIKIFPTCITKSDPDKLEQDYQVLSKHCPSSICTQTTNRVIIWQSRNSRRNLEFLNSVEDQEERNSLKEDLHDCISRSALAGIISSHSSMSNQSERQSTNALLLRYIMEKLSSADDHLKEMFQEIVLLQNTGRKFAWVISTLFFLSFVCTLVGFWRLATQEPPETWWDKFLNCISVTKHVTWTIAQTKAAVLALLS